MAKGLTVKERRFVEALAALGGNATKAAISAGYGPKSAHVTGSQLLRKPKVQAALQSLEKKRAGKHIKTRQELQEYWSERMDDKKAVLRDKLRASELLAKSRGEFVQKVELRGELTLLDLVKESMGHEDTKEAGHETAPGNAGGPAEVVTPPGSVAGEEEPG